MTSRTRSLLVPLLALCGAAAPAAAGPASDKCQAPEHRQFDFWVGDWDGYDVGDETLQARVRVEPVLGGCALDELYEGTNGLHGRSLSSYDAARQRWHQSWFTNRGQLLLVEGRFASGALTFEGANPGSDGRPVLTRVVFKRGEAGAVRQTAHTSADGGKTWKPLFDMLFRPHRQ